MQTSEISRQTRTNAAISYFFLAPIFLLAGLDTPYAHTFVRSHAKSATRLLMLFALVYVVYTWFLLDLISGLIPFLPFSLSRLISGVLFAVFFFLLARGAHRAWKGIEPSSSIRESLGAKATEDIAVRPGELTDTDRVLSVTSCVPFLGIIIAARHPSQVHDIGERIGSITALLYLMMLSGGGDASLMLISLVYIAFVVYCQAMFFSSGKFPFSGIIGNIPTLSEIYQLLRVLPGYILDVGRVVFLQSKEISFRGHLLRIQSEDNKFESAMQTNFPDRSTALPSFLMAIPGVNILFLPRLFSSVAFRYAIMAGQGIVMTFLFIAAFWYYGNSYANELLFFLFPAALILANTEPHSFYRIPVLYEVYALFGILTFGLTNRARKVEEISKKEMSVSYKI